MQNTAKKILALTIFFLGFFALGRISYAATITWTGSGNWNTAGNWSTATVPTSTDDVIFSASSTSACTINTAAKAQSITITSGYAGGTITQNSGQTVTIGSGGYSQAGGTFTGSSGGDAITVNGNFSLTGGTFNSTNGTLTLGGTTDTLSSSSFNANSGIFEIAATSTTITGSSTLYKLYLGSGPFVNPTGNDTFVTIATGTTLTVQNTTLFNQVYTDDVYFGGGGTINAQGDVLLNTNESNPNGLPTSTFNFVLNGAGTQTVSDQGNSSALTLYDQFFFLPNLTINKSSGAVNLVGRIAIVGNFTNMNATAINPGTSTVIFLGASTTSTPITTTLQGSSTFNNLWFGANVFHAATSTFVIATGTTLTAQSQLYFRITFGADLKFLGGGEIDAGGTIETSVSANYRADTISIIVNGTSTQTIGDSSTCLPDGGTGGCSVLFLSNLTITKTSGSVTLANTVDIGSSFTNTNATAINPGTSTVAIGQNFTLAGEYPTNAMSFTLIGSSTFYNFEYGNYAGGTSSTVLTVATGTTVNVQNDFGLTHDQSGMSAQLLGGGQIYVQGNIEGEEFVFPSFPPSTVPIILNGTGTQILGDETACGASYCNYASLPNLTIAKPSGVAYAENTVEIGSSTTISQGELSLATTTASDTVKFDGPLTVASGTILSDYPSASSTLQFGGTVTNNGLVFFDGDGQGCTSVLPNYVILNSTTSNQQVPWAAGSGIFLMRYVNVKDQGGTASIPVLNGTKTGAHVGANWQFITGPEPQIVQTSTASGGSGTSQLNLPLGFQPRAGDMILVAVSARNQSISTPTDTYNNTYTLVASTAFGSSPSYATALYYARNITNGFPFSVTAQGTGGSGQFLSATAFEYTGIAPSSTLDASSSFVDASGNATTLTSLSATGRSAPELYFGVATIGASTTASSASGWTAESGVTNNTTLQSLYIEDQGTSSILTTPALWTSATGTAYGAILGIFRGPYQTGYQTSGSLDSATFDTGVASGTQINSVLWQGTLPAGTQVEFQFAASNSSNGPWNFTGPDGTSNTYFGPVAPGNPQSLVSTTNGYNLFSGYRYFRYRVFLYSDLTHIYSPTVNQVVVNWSP